MCVLRVLALQAGLCPMQADPLQQSWDKRTPLHFAAQHRHPAVIRQLLLHPSLRESPSSAMQNAPVPAMQEHPGSAMQHPPGSALQPISGSAVQHPPGSAVQNFDGSAMPYPPGSAAQHSWGSAMQRPPGSATPHPPGPATPQPPGAAVQPPSMQPALHPHQRASHTNQDQAQDTAELALPAAHLQVGQAHYDTQTDLHSNQTLQQAASHPDYASVQDAASSLRSLQSGIQYESYTGATDREGPDTTSFRASKKSSV